MMILARKFAMRTGLDQTVPRSVKPPMTIRVIIPATKQLARRFATHAGMVRIAISPARRKTALPKTLATILKVSMNEILSHNRGKCYCGHGKRTLSRIRFFVNYPKNIALIFPFSPNLSMFITLP
jgi:hypothetical protein